MKNIDKIKAMTVEEMAEFLAERTSCLICGIPCENGVCVNKMQDWLESEVQPCKETE
jgi:hypothetical protein